MRGRRIPIRPFALVAAAVVVLLAGVWIGGRHPDWLPGPLGDALGPEQSSRVVAEAIDEIHHTYYREIPKDQLADDAIAGAVDKLDDRFSNYFSPSDYRRFKETQNSQFSGVGLQVSGRRDGLRVVAVYDGSPAKRAGVRPGDVIVAVDGRSLRGVREKDAADLIKGPPGSDVRLRWRRGSRTFSKRVERSTVTVPVVASQLRRDGGCPVGVVRLSQFSSGAHGFVAEALRKLKRRGAKAFALDLRDNGGGLVTEAQLVASEFLSDGPIVTTRGRAVKERTLRATGTPVVPKAPLAVLVDDGTASASEIVTGALQDRDRATVVGTKTFGKGVFQEVVELSNGGALDITAGQYFTPKGRNLGGKGVSRGAGIAPDVRAKDDPATARDEGLDAAVKTVGAACPR